MTTITTARGTTAVVLSLFQRLFPDETIHSEVQNATETFRVIVLRSVANRSIACDPCECGISRAVKTALDDYVLEVFTLKHVSYFLCRLADGTCEVVKYQHNGAALVDEVDNKRPLRLDAVITLGPPSPSREVGRQSTAYKYRSDRTIKGPQSAEHIEMRRKSLAEGSSIRRIQKAACMVAN